MPPSPNPSDASPPYAAKAAVHGGAQRQGLAPRGHVRERQSTTVYSEPEAPSHRKPPGNGLVRISPTRQIAQESEDNHGNPYSSIRYPILYGEGADPRSDELIEAEAGADDWPQSTGFARYLPLAALHYHRATGRVS